MAHRVLPDCTTAYALYFLPGAEQRNLLTPFDLPPVYKVYKQAYKQRPHPEGVQKRERTAGLGGLEAGVALLLLGRTARQGFQTLQAFILLLTGARRRHKVGVIVAAPPTRA